MIVRFLAILTALALSACSSASSSGQDAARTGSNDAASAGSNDAATHMCGATPTLHSNSSGDVFCGYNGNQALNCTTGSLCCLGGPFGGGNFAPQACGQTWSASGSGCMNPGAGSVGIACTQIADCSANGITGATIACCIQGATPPKPDPGCTYPRSTQGTAVACESAGTGGGNPTAGTCAAGEVQTCSSNTDCPSGKTCIPGEWTVNEITFQIGFCM